VSGKRFDRGARLMSKGLKFLATRIRLLETSLSKRETKLRLDTAAGYFANWCRERVATSRASVAPEGDEFVTTSFDRKCKMYGE
jgi:hypothetical protein